MWWSPITREMWYEFFKPMDIHPDWLVIRNESFGIRQRILRRHFLILLDFLLWYQLAYSTLNRLFIRRKWTILRLVIIIIDNIDWFSKMNYVLLSSELISIKIFSRWLNAVFWIAVINSNYEQTDFMYFDSNDNDSFNSSNSYGTAFN